MDACYLFYFYFLKPKNEKTKQIKKRNTESKTEIYRLLARRTSLDLPLTHRHWRIPEIWCQPNPRDPCSAAAHFPEKWFIKRYSLGARGIGGGYIIMLGDIHRSGLCMY